MIRSQWLGIVRPILRAEVGDVVKVVFKNIASHNHTIHPHGFRYAKANEGVSGASQDFGGNAVQPGTTWTYVWEVPGKTYFSLTVSLCVDSNTIKNDLGRDPRIHVTSLDLSLRFRRNPRFV